MTAIIPIAAFTDNYIWLLRRGREAAVVDPGDAAPVIAYCDEEDVAITTILATHHHRDHVGGVETLVERFGAKVYGPAREKIPARSRPLAQDDEVDVDAIDASMRVLDIPGHTSGHIAYVGRVDRKPVVFCGDTLFAAGCGKVFEGTPAQMWASLAKLAALEPDTEVYCGHEYTLANLRFARAVEPHNRAIDERTGIERAKRDQGQPTLPSTIGLELATNPFLRAGEPAVKAAAEAQAQRPLADDVAVFATLREWKNRF
ncbi:MAG TPA: hydroxyacylglutathione hydrolase [Casimicrobiaceae bacterium]|nr:hydroxyacylglutathione hydrolase [Casimicrobiaceae bacterium]